MASTDSSREATSSKAEALQPASSNTANEQKVFRYLDLPAELQLAILEIAVVQPEIIYVSWKPKSAVPPAITEVSKAIRADALPLFYKMNHFTAKYCPLNGLGGPRTLAWLEAIGPETRELMTGLRLEDHYVQEDCEDPCIAKFKELAPRGAQFNKMHVRWQCEYGLTFTKPRE